MPAGRAFFGLDQHVCYTILAALVAEGYLRLAGSEAFVRAPSEVTSAWRSR